MYYFNKDNILECSAQIAKKRYELEECSKRLTDLVNRLSEDHKTASIRRQIVTIGKYMREELERLSRLEYTLSYAASTYTDSDRKCANISSSDRRQAHRLVNKMLGASSGNGEIHLAVNVVMR